MLLPILFLFKTKISDYFKYSSYYTILFLMEMLTDKKGIVFQF